MDLIINHRYPAADTFSGHAEKCEWTATIPLIPSTAGLVEAFAAKAAENSGQMLTLKIWQEVEWVGGDGEAPLPFVTLTGEAVASASPLWWTPIIMGALGLAMMLVIAFTVVRVTDVAWNPEATKRLSEVGKSLTEPLAAPFEAVKWGGLALLGLGALLFLWPLRPRGKAQ